MQQLQRQVTALIKMVLVYQNEIKPYQKYTPKGAGREARRGAWLLKGRSCKRQAKVLAAHMGAVKEAREGAFEKVKVITYGCIRHDCGRISHCTVLKGIQDPSRLADEGASTVVPDAIVHECALTRCAELQPCGQCLILSESAITFCSVSQSLTPWRARRLLRQDCSSDPLMHDATAGFEQAHDYLPVHASPANAG